MGMLSHANTRDANEPEMFELCRKIGATYMSLHVTDGPDAAIGFRKKNFLVEFKLPPGPRGGTSHSKQTPKQKESQSAWRGQWDVIRTPEELVDLLCGPSAIVSKGCR